MILIIVAITNGLLLAMLALGVFISFRIFDFPDITVDGSYTLGAAITAVGIVHHVNPVLATAAGFLGGLCAGTLTGILHSKFKINKLLSGILVMTALYSINLHIMGTSFILLLGKPTLMTYSKNLSASIFGDSRELQMLGMDLDAQDVIILVMALILIPLIVWCLYLFFKTHVGLAMRASGDNAQMARALGVNDGNMIILGVALANGLASLSGALMAQLAGNADIQMGIGIIVTGLAAVIIGEALLGKKKFGVAIMSVVIGSVFFRLIIVLVLRSSPGANDLKLYTAAFVFAALVLPELYKKLKLHQKLKEK